MWDIYGEELILKAVEKFWKRRKGAQESDRNLRIMWSILITLSTTWYTFTLHSPAFTLHLWASMVQFLFLFISFLSHLSFLVCYKLLYFMLHWVDHALAFRTSAIKIIFETYVRTPRPFKLYWPSHSGPLQLARLVCQT